MEIKALSNGFVVFGNDKEVMEVRPHLIDVIRIFSPSETSDLLWRVQISGENIGYISFPTDNKEQAEDILRRINEVM